MKLLRVLHDTRFGVSRISHSFYLSVFCFRGLLWALTADKAFSIALGPYLWIENKLVLLNCSVKIAAKGYR